jgi:hypothetical protein
VVAVSGSVRLFAILLSLTAAGCAHTEDAPATLSTCSIASAPAKNGYVVTYTFVLKSATTRTIVATRIGSQPWRMAAVPIRDYRSGAVYDDQQRLPPNSSHTIYLRTSIIPGRRLFGSTPMACDVVGVVYTDGTYWTARRGLVPPMLGKHGPL